jgi:hypothetical protein
MVSKKSGTSERLVSLKQEEEATLGMGDISY